MNELPSLPTAVAGHCIFGADDVEFQRQALEYLPMSRESDQDLLPAKRVDAVIAIDDAATSRRTAKAARLRETIDSNAAAWSRENAAHIASLRAQIRSGESSAFRWIDPATASVPLLNEDSVAQLLGAKRL
ncbi:MAG: hypothetical protein ABWY64_11030 [Tardiphaga sp.]